MIPLAAGGGILWTVLIVVLIIAALAFIFGRGRRF